MNPASTKPKTNMKTKPSQSAFTLIELLVVITIIGVLSALSIPAIGAASRKVKLAVAKSELASIETAISGYKHDFAFYPPSGTDPLVNPLYIELAGTVMTNKTSYVLLDNPAQGIVTIPANSIKGYLNATRDQSGEDVPFAKNYFKSLSPKMVAEPQAGFPVLVSTVGDLNVWRYKNHGDHNTETYDLWLQLVINGRTNLICNWSKAVQINTADQ